MKQIQGVWRSIMSIGYIFTLLKSFLLGQALLKRSFYFCTNVGKDLGEFQYMSFWKENLCPSLTSGIGTHVKKTVTSRKNFLPQMSERAPTRGAARNDRMPLIPTIRPFIRNVFSGKVEFKTLEKIWKIIRNCWQNLAWIKKVILLCAYDSASYA